ncbi:hypothetical protein OUY22_04795 [Nonomuraea sp. MCN248]|uniref:Potassium/proton antiporter subunit KhtT-like N-terminal domain-containing protein n=1 Tax=Nonomuraea corallina TaxID=2989783 RepID=A0ABT4S6F4_9ACTN|nr:hypothetical protein [Nonomuraea corallina]MDA0632725.1 hypothetical protein [Nonomuraea corallina]
MELTHHTIPGTGTVHHGDTLRGDHLAVVVTQTGRTLLLYDQADPDTPAHTLRLDQREADQLADLLHSRPAADRLAEVERRLAAVEQRLAA